MLYLINNYLYNISHRINYLNKFENCLTSKYGIDYLICNDYSVNRLYELADKLVRKTFNIDLLLNNKLMDKKLSLSFSAINLIKHTLSTDGKKEIDGKGQEVLSALKLNGQESAQRRHFFKKIEEYEKTTREDLQKEIDKFNELRKSTLDELKKENKKKKDEEEKDYDERISKLLVKDKKFEKAGKDIQEFSIALNKKIVEIEVTEDTLKVLKKYFNEFGEKVGWGVGDDEVVEEIEIALAE